MEVPTASPSKTHNCTIGPAVSSDVGAQLDPKTVIFLPSATVSQATCRGHDRDAQTTGKMRREPGTFLSASAAAWKLSAKSVGHTVLVSSLKRYTQSSMWMVGWPCWTSRMTGSQSQSLVWSHNGSSQSSH